MEKIEITAIRAMVSREAVIWIKDKKSLFLRFFIQPAIITVTFGKLLAPHVDPAQNYSLVIITGVALSFVMNFCTLNISNNIMLGYNTRLFETWLCSPAGVNGVVVGLLIGASANGCAAGFIILLTNCFIFNEPVFSVIPAFPLVMLSSILFSALACILYLAPATPMNAQGIVPYYALPMANLGCVYFSYSMLPAGWNYLSLLIPMTYATEAVRSTLSTSGLFGSMITAYLAVSILALLALLALFRIANYRLGEYTW